MSIDSDREEYSSINSCDEYDSDKMSSDLENELYSQLYYSSCVDNFEKLENNKPDVSVSRNGGENNNSSVVNTFGHPVLIDRNPRQSSVSNFQSTPKTSISATTQADGKISSKLFEHSSDDSESDCDDGVVFLDSWEATDNVVTNVQNEKKCVRGENSNYETVNSSETDTEGNSSSSVIVIDEVKTNPSVNFIPITIDSDSSESSDESDDYLSQSLPTNFKVSNDENNKLWQIDIEDRFRSLKSKRYYRKSEPNCRICRGFGHTMKNCPKQVMKCYLCGGKHTSFKCNKKVCGICFETGHTRNFCSLNGHNMYCKMCKLIGHKVNRCPDKWRRYSFITEDGKEGKSKGNETQQKYCYNCGCPGHIGFSCLKPRPVTTSLPASPYVVNKTLNIRNTMKEKSPQKKQVLQNGMNGYQMVQSPPKKQILQNGINGGKSLAKKRKKKKKLSNEEPAFLRTPLGLPANTATNKFLKKKKKWKAVQKKFNLQKWKKRKNLKSEPFTPC